MAVRVRIPALQQSGRDVLLALEIGGSHESAASVRALEEG